VGGRMFEKMLADNEEKVRELLIEYVEKYGSDIFKHINELFVDCGKALNLVIVDKEFLMKKFDVRPTTAELGIKGIYDSVIKETSQIEVKEPFIVIKHLEMHYQLFYSLVYDEFATLVIILMFDENLNLAHFDFLWRIKIP
jgi:hypothetical protein